MDEQISNTKQGYEWFVEQFKMTTGIDLTYYKRPQMERRLLSLCNKRGYNSFEEYFPVVCKDQELMEELLDRMTINVSEFFRNPTRWETLITRVIPRLYTGQTFSAWSAACSSGQEPYTLLMLLLTLMPISNVSILATDIDSHALDIARRGIYPEKEIDLIDSPMRNQYFSNRGLNKVQIHDALRNAITFKQHNLLSDSYPRNLDLIICRNVLIYFTDDAKNAIARKFAQALKPGGILFVGGTEQIFHPEAFQFKQILPFFYERL